MKSKKGSSGGLILLVVIVLFVSIMLLFFIGESQKHTTRTNYTAHENESFNSTVQVVEDMVKFNGVIPFLLIGVAFVTGLMFLWVRDK